MSACFRLFQKRSCCPDEKGCGSFLTLVSWKFFPTYLKAACAKSRNSISPSSEQPATPPLAAQGISERRARNTPRLCAEAPDSDCQRGYLSMLTRANTARPQDSGDFDA